MLLEKKEKYTSFFGCYLYLMHDPDTYIKIRYNHITKSQEGKMWNKPLVTSEMKSESERDYYKV